MSFLFFLQRQFIYLTGGVLSCSTILLVSAVWGSDSAICLYTYIPSLFFFFFGLNNKLFQYQENISVNILLKALEEILTGVLYFQIDFHYETGAILLQKKILSSRYNKLHFKMQRNEKREPRIKEEIGEIMYIDLDNKKLVK